VHVLDGADAGVSVCVPSFERERTCVCLYVCVSLFERECTCWMARVLV